MAVGAAWVLAACDAPAELQPDQALMDSLGLTTRDRVHTVDLTLDAGQEVARPDTLRVLQGDWVAFRSADGFVRLITFDADSLAEPARAWLSGQGNQGSPPLVAPGARWLVHFQAAPAGRYPFQVLGAREAGWGVVIVDARRRFPFYTP